MEGSVEPGEGALVSEAQESFSWEFQRIVTTNAGDVDASNMAHLCGSSGWFLEAANQYLRDSFIGALVMKQGFLIKLDPGPLMAA